MTIVLANTKVKGHSNSFGTWHSNSANVFGARHGKGPTDGVVGRIKSAAKGAVKARQVVIKNARQFADFCKAQFKLNDYDPSKKELQHFIQEIFFVKDIPEMNV